MIVPPINVSPINFHTQNILVLDDKRDASIPSASQSQQDQPSSRSRQEEVLVIQQQKAPKLTELNSSGEENTPKRLTLDDLIAKTKKKKE